MWVWYNTLFPHNKMAGVVFGSFLVAPPNLVPPVFCHVLVSSGCGLLLLQEYGAVQLF